MKRKRLIVPSFLVLRFGYGFFRNSLKGKLHFLLETTSTLPLVSAYVALPQLGAEDERDLFPKALRLVEQSKPVAVMLENVPGFATQRFSEYRRKLIEQLLQLGYDVDWRIVNASSFGVPQLRPRFLLVALRQPYFSAFRWPESSLKTPTVSAAISDLMEENGWAGVETWRHKANSIAPTLVGGSKKHGGPDLGPTRARNQWERLGVDGKGIADFPPGPDFPIHSLPRLTLRMTARLQAFPDSWTFAGGKTAAYRQFGNALPPPVAQAVGTSIYTALTGIHGQEQYKATFFQPLLFRKGWIYMSNVWTCSRGRRPF